MSHHHHHHHRSTGIRLLITLVLNLIIPAAQLIGGLMANSVALISDAIHNFSDSTGVLIAYLALRIGAKGPSKANTFGYRRVEIVAAVVNVALLIGASAVIAFGAVNRLRNPEPVTGWTVAAIASLGIVGNGLSAWLLHRDAHHSLNIRGAFLHMLGDLFFSVVVAINGLVLMVYPWYWLDPLLSLLIVAFIVKNAVAVLRSALAVLMNATPQGLDIETVKAALEGIEGVCGIHYLHAWCIDGNRTALLCHVVVPDQPVSGTAGLTARINRVLLEDFNIGHTTLQFETRPCGSGDLLCENTCNF